MHNIELKTALDSIPRMEQKLRALGVQHKGLLRQVDTYFNCPNGRLKLRQINTSENELIFYQRPDTPNSTESTYQVIRLTRQQVREHKKLLTDAYGIRIVVQKQRRLWMYKNTRIHLDRVTGLGMFLELETVVRNQTMQQARAEQRDVIKKLQLHRFKKHSRSYSDMLVRKK